MSRVFAAFRAPVNRIGIATDRTERDKKGTDWQNSDRVGGGDVHGTFPPVRDTVREAAERERDEAQAREAVLREKAQKVVDELLHSTIAFYHRNGPTWTISGEVGEVFPVSKLLDREDILRELDAALTSTAASAAARDASIREEGRREGLTALADKLQREHDVWVSENGLQDLETGVMEFGNTAMADYDSDRLELIDEIRTMAGAASDAPRTSRYWRPMLPPPPADVDTPDA